LAKFEDWNFGNAIGVDVVMEDGKTLRICDILTGTWAWCRKENTMLNTKKEVLEIEYDEIKEILEQIESDNDKIKPVPVKKVAPTKKAAVKTTTTTVTKTVSKPKEELKPTKSNKKTRSIDDDDDEDEYDEYMAEILNLQPNKVYRKDKLLIDMLPPKVSTDTKKWVKMGYMINDMYENDKDEGFKRFLMFSSISPKYESDKIKQQYKGYEGKTTHTKQYDSNRYRIPCFADHLNISGLFC